MTIKRGESWGERRIPPAHLMVATSDAEAATLIASGGREFFLSGGDMWRTIGGSSAPRTTLNSESTVVVLDSMVASYRQDSAFHQQPVFAHAVFTSLRDPQRRMLSWLHRVVGGVNVAYAMNAQYLKRWDVAPRGHPNDGRFDLLTVSATMPWRQRWQFRRRLLTGSHVPHPLVEMRSYAKSWSPQGTGFLILDGQDVGRVADLTISLVPDSLTVWIW